MDPVQRLDELRIEIRRHEELYYQRNAPEISDEAFDKLLHELEQLEAEHPDLVTPDSPTQRVAGRPVEGFQTVAHLAPMLSLDNAYNEEELRAFDERVRRAAGLGDAPVAYVAELKIDGLSIALTYQNGRLVRGATRGDGTLGEDGTVNVRTVRSTPLALRRSFPNDRIEVRGEVFLPRKSFERMNREQAEAGEPLYANARNTAAGTMRNLDPALVARRQLSAFTYQVVHGPTPKPSAEAEGGRDEDATADGHGARLQPDLRHSDLLDAMHDWGLPVEPHWCRCASMDEVIAFCHEWADKRQALEFDTDGVVIKVDDLAL